MKYSFTWNGTNSRDKGLFLQEMPLIVRPEERVEHVTIPGRSGELTITEGVDVFNSYIQTVHVLVDSLEHVKDIQYWLTGDGYVTFSCEPLRKQRARVINAVEFKKYSRNSSFWEADVQFYCEPLKQALTEDVINITESGQQVENPGDVASRPQITVIGGSGNVTIRIGTRSINLKSLTDTVIVDCEAEWVTDDEGEPLPNIYTGSFPIIGVGTKTVQVTGTFTKLEIQPRWRYL